MLRCSSCQKTIYKDTAWLNWITVFNFIDHLYNEEEITQATHENITNCLLGLKCFVDESEEKEKGVDN